MTNEEAKQAFKSQVKIVHNCRCSGSLIVYKRIKEFKYVAKNDGTFYTSIGLIDDKENCLVWDIPQNVELYDKNKPLDRDHYFNNSRQP